MIKKVLGMIRKCEQRSDIESKEVVKQCPKCLSVLNAAFKERTVFNSAVKARHSLPKIIWDHFGVNLEITPR